MRVTFGYFWHNLLLQICNSELPIIMLFNSFIRVFSLNSKYSPANLKSLRNYWTVSHKYATIKIFSWNPIIYLVVVKKFFFWQSNCWQLCSCRYLIEFVLYIHCPAQPAGFIFSCDILLYSYRLFIKHHVKTLFIFWYFEFANTYIKREKTNKMCSKKKPCICSDLQLYLSNGWISIKCYVLILWIYYFYYIYICYTIYYSLFKIANLLLSTGI